MKANFDKKQGDDELREEYDLSKMTVLPRGGFDPKRRLGTNVVVLEPEIAKAFPNDEAVNEALRLVLKATKIPQQTARQATLSLKPFRLVTHDPLRLFVED